MQIKVNNELCLTIYFGFVDKYCDPNATILILTYVLSLVMHPKINRTFICKVHYRVPNRAERDGEDI